MLAARHDDDIYIYIYKSVMTKVVDCGLEASEFELHAPYYVHFRNNTLGKGMNPFILPRKGLNSTTPVLLQGGTFGLNNPRRLICHLTKEPNY